jgi:hypothetical protein
MPNVAKILHHHTTLDIRCVNRLYLNAYIPGLQYPGGVIERLVKALGRPIPSPALFGEMTQQFKKRLQEWARQLVLLCRQEAQPTTSHLHQEPDETSILTARERSSQNA